MRRRELLGLTASALAATAGCTAEEETATDEPTPSESPPTDTPTPADTTPTDSTATPTPNTVESVTLEALQPGLVKMASPDSLGVISEDDSQYLLVSVAVTDEGGPAREEFSLSLDDTTYAPREIERLWRTFDGEPQAYSAAGGGLLVFELAATAADPSTAQLQWPGGSWDLPDSVHTRLETAAPSFDVSVDAPETVPVGESPEVTVTAANTGTVAGQFLLAFNRAGPLIAYSPQGATRDVLAAGESGEWTLTADGIQHDMVSDGDTATLHFHWLGGHISRDVEFVATE